MPRKLSVTPRTHSRKISTISTLSQPTSSPTVHKENMAWLKSDSLRSAMPVIYLATRWITIITVWYFQSTLWALRSLIEREIVSLLEEFDWISTILLLSHIFSHMHAARHFITRALLSADTFEKAQKILRDSGTGAADGCSINMTFLKWVIGYFT